MLSSLLTVGTKLYGLRKFLMESREPTNGFYRLVSGMGPRYIQFSEGAAEGKTSITMLPYRVGQIKNTLMQADEVISGEFTGCVMAMYNDDGGTRRCAHVCTQDGYSQRDAWGELAKTNVVQLDTRGMVANFHGATLNTSVLAIANPATNTISHVFVERGHDPLFKNGANTMETYYQVISVP